MWDVIILIPDNCLSIYISSHLMQSEIIIYGLVRKFVKLSPSSLTIFI